MASFIKSKEVSEESPLLLSETTKKNSQSSSCEDFDDILKVVGSEGRWQNILLYCLMCPIAILVDNPLNMNMFFMMYIPDHWCYVPGRQNETEELWKNMTIPTEEGPDGQPLGFSQCKMYDPMSIRKGSDEAIIIDCQYGWDYDKTYYSSTIPTQYEWLCSKSHYVTQAFTISTIGNAIGSLALGHLGDKVGRKKIVILSMIIGLVFGGTSLFLASNFPAFLALQFLSGLAYPSLITAVCLVASETCSPEYRSWVFSLLCFCRVIGNTIFPTIYWAIGSWFLIGIISTIPTLLFIVICLIFFPESPRWLMSMGRLDEAHALFMKMAKTNNNKMDVSSLQIKADIFKIQTTLKAKEDTKGVLGAWTLFSRKRLATHTLLLSTTWAIIGLSFYGLNLNTLNMGGNPFLNHMMIIGWIELPSGWVLKFLVENFGRRWTQTVLLLLTGIACICSVIFVTSTGSNNTLNVLICGFVAKFLIVICDLITDLQASELFPTKLRATGFSLATTMSSFMQILGPSLILLGNAATPYITLSILTIIAALLASFLPETFRRNLPETIEEANNIGRHDKFFSFLPSLK